MDIQTVEQDEILLVGYKKNTRFGFWVIGQCFRKLHVKKSAIPHRINTDFLIGLNDYANWDVTMNRQPSYREVSRYSTNSVFNTQQQMNQHGSGERWACCM